MGCLLSVNWLEAKGLMLGLVFEIRIREFCW